MTIRVYGHVETMSVGPMGMIELTLRIETSRSRELVNILATKEELSTLYYPGKPITIQITPNP